MSQYNTGTVTTDGTATVEGTGTTWNGGNVSAGDLFRVVGHNATYEVASVTDADTLVLTSAYAGANVSGATYTIVRDFTARLGLPYPTPNDIETAAIIKRAFSDIDAYTNIAQSNTSATTAPTTGDDTDDGYSVGSKWIDVTADEVYVCVDATASAAVWLQTTLNGLTATIAELNYVDGVTSNIQTQLGTKLPLAGGTMTGDVSLGDNVKAKFGASDDLQIYHDGSNSYIDETGTGNLRIRANDQVKLQKYTGENMFVGIADGAASIYHDNVQKLATTSTGIDVTGSVTCDGFTSTGIDDNATSTAITIDASESVGIDVIPSAWHSAIPGFQIGQSGASYSSSSSQLVAIANSYYSQTGSRYINSAASSYYSQNAGVHKFYNAPSGTADALVTYTERMSIDSAGDVNVKTGNLVIGTSGKGIDFSAVSDGSRSVSSNLLDDYEEGTWTPVAYGATTAGSYAYSYQYGKYTKIGNVVHYTLNIVTTSGTSGTGEMRVSGLPFTNAASRNYCMAATYNSHSAATTGSSAYVHPSSTFLRFGHNIDADTVFELRVTGTYNV